MSTHPRFLFEVWLGISEWHPEAMGANAKEWTERVVKNFDLVLELCPVGTPEPMAMHTALLRMENCDAEPLIKYADSCDLWSLPSAQRAEAFKIVTTCVRAYGRIPGNDVPLSAEQTLSCMDWEFGRGRYTMHSDRAKELKERSRETRHLRVSGIFAGAGGMNQEGVIGHPKFDGLFYDMLWDELLGVAAEVVSPHNVKRTIKDHLLERHEWLA